MTEERRTNERCKMREYVDADTRIRRGLWLLTQEGTTTEEKLREVFLDATSDLAAYLGVEKITDLIKLNVYTRNTQVFFDMEALSEDGEEVVGTLGGLAARNHSTTGKA